MMLQSTFAMIRPHRGYLNGLEAIVHECKKLRCSAEGTNANSGKRNSYLCRARQVPLAAGMLTVCFVLAAVATLLQSQRIWSAVWLAAVGNTKLESDCQNIN